MVRLLDQCWLPDFYLSLLLSRVVIGIGGLSYSAVSRWTQEWPLWSWICVCVSVEACERQRGGDVNQDVAERRETQTIEGNCAGTWTDCHVFQSFMVTHVHWLCGFILFCVCLFVCLFVCQGMEKNGSSRPMTRSHAKFAGKFRSKSPPPPTAKKVRCSLTPKTLTFVDWKWYIIRLYN